MRSSAVASETRDEGRLLRFRVSDEEILRAARRCIDAVGPDHFTMADVARAAGLTRVQIHNRFGTRDGVILALLVRQAERFNASVAGDLAEAPAIAEAIVAVMRRAIAAARADRYFAAFVGPATGGRGVIAGAPAAALAAARRRWLEPLRRGLATGELVSPMSPETIADWFALTELSLFNATGAFGLSADACERYIRAFVVAPLRAPGWAPSSPAPEGR